VYRLKLTNIVKLILSELIVNKIINKKSFRFQPLYLEIKALNAFGRPFNSFS
jgi:hypothetical protein